MNEIPFAYFGNKLLQKLSKDGIKITEEVYKKIFDFLKEYKPKIDEDPYDENFLNKVYLKVREFLKR